MTWDRSRGSSPNKEKASHALQENAGTDSDRLNRLAMRSSESISWFADITLSDRPAVGGKGGSLGELAHAGIAVPPGFVIRTTAFERFIAALEEDGPIRAGVAELEGHDLNGITALSESLRARFDHAPLPANVHLNMLAAQNDYCVRKNRPRA